MKMAYMGMTTKRFWTLTGFAIALTLAAAIGEALFGHIDKAVAYTIFAFLQAVLAIVLHVIRPNAHIGRR